MDMQQLPPPPLIHVIGQEFSEASMFFLAYVVLIIIAVLLDLYTGFQKTKVLYGTKPITEGFRRTANKALNYFILLIMFGCFDIVSISCLTNLHLKGSWMGIPTFPFFSMFVTLLVIAIEVHSMWENLNAKKTGVDTHTMRDRVIDTVSDTKEVIGMTTGLILEVKKLSQEIAEIKQNTTKISQ